MDKITVVNRHYESYDVYIGRGTKWGNPFEIGKDGTREEVIELYRQYARNNPNIYNHLNELKGKRLGCSCKPLLCHGDILVEMVNNMEKKYNKIVIGIDQSYTCTGISIAADNRLMKASSINFKGCRTKSDKRKCLANRINQVIKLNQPKAKEMIILCERIRTFSQGNKGDKDFGLRPNYLKATGALIATIVDTAYEHGIPVYSIDTRSWKSQIVGSNNILPSHKNEIKPEKMGAIEYIESLGFDCKQYNEDGTVKISSRGKHQGKIKYDDDKADSACIALYGFIPNNRQKLQLEE